MNFINHNVVLNKTLHFLFHSSLCPFVCCILVKIVVFRCFAFKVITEILSSDCGIETCLDLSRSFDFSLLSRLKKKSVSKVRITKDFHSQELFADVKK